MRRNEYTLSDHTYCPYTMPTHSLYALRSMVLAGLLKTHSVYTINCVMMDIEHQLYARKWWRRLFKRKWWNG